MTGIRIRTIHRVRRIILRGRILALIEFFTAAAGSSLRATAESRTATATTPSTGTTTTAFVWLKTQTDLSPSDLSALVTELLPYKSTYYWKPCE